MLTQRPRVRIPLKLRKSFFFGLFSQLLKLRFTVMVTYSFHLYSRRSHQSRALQSTAEHCRALQSTAEHCSALQFTSVHSGCKIICHIWHVVSHPNIHPTLTLKLQCLGLITAPGSKIIYHICHVVSHPNLHLTLILKLQCLGLITAPGCKIICHICHVVSHPNLHLTLTLKL